MEAPYKIWLQSVQQFPRKKKWKCWIWETLDQGQWMTLTFDIHIGSWTHLVNCIYQLWYHRQQWFLKKTLFYLFPCKSTRDQIWPSRKIAQGQPRVIIWTNLVVLERPMLHTKFHGHRPFGSGEDFLRLLPYMGMAAILVMWPGPFEQTFVPPSHGGSIWNLASIGPVASEEKLF